MEVLKTVTSKDRLDKITESLNVDTLTIQSVSIDARFTAVWGEINTRLALRTQNISNFITLMIIVATISQIKIEGLDTKWIVLCVPVVSLMSSMTNYMHSRIIQNLTHYLEDLEHLNNSHSRLPNYLTDADYYKSDDKAMRLQQVVFLLLMALFNLLAYLFEYFLKPEIFYANSGIVLISIAATLSSLMLVVLSFKMKRVKPVSRRILDSAEKGAS